MVLKHKEFGCILCRSQESVLFSNIDIGLGLLKMVNSAVTPVIRWSLKLTENQGNLF
jgi:hypothetical protein